MVNTKAKQGSSNTTSAKNASPKTKSKKDAPDKLPRVDPKKSPAVTRSSKAVASKSPSRLDKSPSARGRGRPRSVGRSSPARVRSPARSPVKKSISASAVSTKAPATIKQKKIIEIDSDSDGPDFSHPAEKPKATVRGRARRLDVPRVTPKVILENIRKSVDKDLDSYINVVRRSVQKTQPPEVQRIVHLQHEPTLKKLTEFSDDDDLVLKNKEKEKQTEPIVTDNRKVGLRGTLGALLVLILCPIYPLILYISCSETQCSLIKCPSIQRYKYISSYFDKNAFLVISGLTGLVALLCAIPFGGPKVSGMPNKQGKLSYTMNGLFTAIISIITLFLLEFFNIPVISIITQKYFQLIISGIILGFIISIYLYSRSFFVPISALNSQAITNNRLYNFLVGREVNPRILKLDLKLFLLRLHCLLIVILVSVFLYKGIDFTKSSPPKEGFDILALQINPTLLVIALLQLVYCLDFFIFEQTLITCRTIQYEGVGYFTSLSTFIGPFAVASVTKYIYDYKVSLPVWQLILSLLLFCCGYFIFRASNCQKHAFRLNPYSPSVSHLESLPTSQGKKLLVSGFWGFVRHPNYLGDILIQLSFALFVVTKPPAIACLVDILYLVFRAKQDGVRCKQVYGNVWDRYCQRVKYILIPKVY